MDQGLAAAAARMNVACPTRSGARISTGVLAALGLLAGVSDAGAQVPRRIRWAALGNSITQGSGYPDKLQALLGPAFLVENEGVSATTMLKKSNYSYWTNGRFAQTFAFKPDIVSVKLGTNDSKPANWSAGRSAFLTDTRAMVDTLRGMPSKPLAFLCYPVPVFQKNGAWSVDGINDPVIKNQAIRVACIGNSITDNGHDAQAYPVRLNMRLGRDHFVLNAGHSGYTLLRKGDSPYFRSPWFAEVFKFQPHVITIKLGTNDTKAYNWDAHKGEFVSDLRWMVDTLMTMVSKPKIYLCTPIPAWKSPDGSYPFGIRGEVIQSEVIPKIKQVAEEKGLKVLDLHTPFLPYQRLTSDGVHPTAEGPDTLSSLLHRAYTAAGPVSIHGDRSGGDGSRLRGRGLPASRGADGAAGLLHAPANPLAPLGVDAAGRKLD